MQASGTGPRVGASRRGVHVRWIPVDEDAPDPRRLLGHLDSQERHRFEADRDPSSAAGFVLGRALARVLVGELTGTPAHDVRIRAVCSRCGGAHGMPRADCPGADAPQISIAHCLSAVVVAASFDGPVGIDVELSEHARSPERRAAITALAGSPFGTVRDDDPLLHWTRVEAALKADGRGPAVDPRAVRVHTLGTVAEARFAEGRRYRLASPGIDASLRVSVAIGAEGVEGSGMLLAWRREDAESLLGALGAPPLRAVAESA